VSELPFIVEHNIALEDVNVGCLEANWLVKLELISRYCKLGKSVSELPFIVEHNIALEDVNVGCLEANWLVKLELISKYPNVVFDIPFIDAQIKAFTVVDAVDDVIVKFPELSTLKIMPSLFESIEFIWDWTFDVKVLQYFKFENSTGDIVIELTVKFPELS
jgi:hypothetical protein